MSTVAPTPTVGNSHKLTLTDLTAAYRLPVAELNALAARIVESLKTIPAVCGRDPAGIAKRGSLVFDEHLEGHPINELAAAYVYLNNRQCQSGLRDRLEMADGIV